jgi:hypothetical protein
MDAEQELLSSVPVPAVAFEKSADGIVTLLNEKSGNRVIRKILDFFKAGQLFRVRLDEVGSRSWLLADGRRTVFEIVRDLRAAFGERVEPAEKRVALFFLQLYKAKQVKLYKKTEEKDE